MRIAAYLRVSTDQQSYESQRADLEGYCQRWGWTNVQLVHGHRFGGQERPGTAGGPHGAGSPGQAGRRGDVQVGPPRPLPPSSRPAHRRISGPSRCSRVPLAGDRYVQLQPGSDAPDQRPGGRGPIRARDHHRTGQRWHRCGQGPWGEIRV